uniref:Uncharacterized protein n=1 Tax=Anguilla anguilla TaxID=7936 RepID=A0A0E9XZR0_ANGAN
MLISYEKLLQSTQVNNNEKNSVFPQLPFVIEHTLAFCAKAIVNKKAK